VRESSIYETDPVGYLEQPAYLNMVVAVETILDPLSLLHDLLDMELQLGRIRTIRWGPRTIDLDLLLYNHVRMDTPELILPHPRMLERAFVMIPLIEIANSFYLKQLDVENWTASKRKEGIKIWTPMP
jgi:2-amino-4-hydroxy-6-hydroxymethyldihydropteridine diphosphokinase